MIITQFSDNNQHGVFSGHRKYQLTIAHYTPFQYWGTLRFNSNSRFKKVFSSFVKIGMTRGGDIRYRNGITIRTHSRPERLQVSFCSFSRSTNG